LPFGTIDDRLAALRDAVRATRDHGFPVWVGGTSTPVRALAAAEADGWNYWGGDFGRFARFATEVGAAARRPAFTISWGGLVVLEATDRAATAKAERLGAAPGTIVGGPERVAEALRARAAAGAEWLIVGPVDSANPDNAELLTTLVAPLLAS
jgi:alkanesulfonate monooxygenase SsuD/methylene tetrahydromethanopterin reductase-like flavin-dependent oxidoreductase (luciferase family)